MNLQLTQAPLITFSDIGKLLFCKLLPEEELMAPWLKQEDHGYWFSRSTWSLLAIALLCQKIKNTPNVTIWFPDYFCNSALYQLRKNGIIIKYYHVTDQMTPNWDQCKNMAETSPPDIFILVHFFGKPSSVGIAQHFCLSNKIWLIEDAAHVMLPTEGIGTQGDFVLYSPHKHIPLPDGAILSIRKNGPSRILEMDIELVTFKLIYYSLINSANKSIQTSLIWMAKRTLQMIGVRKLNKTYIKYQNENPSNPTNIQPKISFLSLCLLSIFISHIKELAANRNQNDRNWKELLDMSKLIEYQEWSDCKSYIPYMSCITFSSIISAEKAYNQLSKFGLPVMTWPDIPPEIINQYKGTRNHALKFRTTKIYLPVHTSITYDKIALAIKKIKTPNA